MDRFYVDTVRLLLATLPEVFAFPKFALKGGTAINLFVHDMPRLSVDIDVVFTDHLKPRTDALREIAGGLTAAQQRLKSRGIESELTTAPQGEETKLFVKQNRLAVKVEVNHVFRGTLLPVTTKRLNEMPGAFSRRRFRRRFWRPRSFTAAKLWPRWTASIRVTSSTSGKCSPKQDLPPLWQTASPATWQDIIARSTKSSSHVTATCGWFSKMSSKA